MAFRVPHAVMAGVVFFALGTSPSRAVVIDDFNRTTPGPTYHIGPDSAWTPTKNWVEVEAQSQDVAIIEYPNPNDGVLQLRDYRSGLPDAQATLYGIVIPASLINIKIGFEYLGHATDAADLLYVQWKRSSESEAQWKAGGTYTLESSSFKDALFALPDDVTSIDLRFWTDVTDSYEVCGYSNRRYKCTTKEGDHDQTAKIDNIFYDGTEPAPSPTPIPGALPLFMSGAALFGGLMYRRKRKALPAA